MSETPRLLLRPGYGYQIKGLSLGLWKNAPPPTPWIFHLLHPGREQEEWLSSSGLRGQHFRTRSEALTRLQDLLQLMPPPAQMSCEPPSFLREGRGLYRSRDREWQVQREGDRWVCRRASTPRLSRMSACYTHTLARAAFTVWKAEREEEEEALSSSRSKRSSRPPR